MLFLVFSEAIKDKKVVGAKGILIGQVEGIDFSTDTWKVTHFIVRWQDKVARKLGYKSGIRTKQNVLIPVDAIDKIGDVVTIKRGIENLSDLERVEAEAASPI
jgi:sporulation protein YlmC with PRC-barrel domain